MIDQANSLKDDISYMRDLAVQGRKGPLLGGAFLAAAGLIYGVAGVLHWAILTGRLPFAAFLAGNIWMDASALFAAVWVVLFLRLRGRANTAIGTAQYAFGTAWAGSGLGIAVTLAATAIMSARLHDSSLLNLNTITAFAFYGAAWSVSATLARQRWMFAIAAAAFVIALLLALVSGTPDELLVFGAGLIVTLFLPGLKLMFPASH